VKEYLPMQDGDVVRTFADVSDLEKCVGYKPETDLQVGIDEYSEWYMAFYL